MVAQQNEFVGVSPETQNQIRALAQIPFQARKPGLVRPQELNGP
jgi:hypothetical protein